MFAVAEGEIDHESINLQLNVFDLLGANDIFDGDFYPNEIDFSNIIWDSEHQLDDSICTSSGELPKINHKETLQIPLSAPFPVATFVAANRQKSQSTQIKVHQHEILFESDKQGVDRTKLKVDDSVNFSMGSVVERRERNREHAKQSRSRKRVLLDALSDRLTQLREQNVKLRSVISENLPSHLATQVLSECTEQESTLLSSEVSSQSSSTALEAKQLVQPDYRLVQSLITSQQNFLLTDPTLSDNPIVYASDGFCKLTKYKKSDILGRNCRFLQGAGTDPMAVNLIRQGIADNRDVSVCLLNYKADGTPFWNQFFLGALKDSEGKVVNFVGVQCEVNIIPVTELKDQVKRLPIS